MKTLLITLAAVLFTAIANITNNFLIVEEPEQEHLKQKSGMNYLMYNLNPGLGVPLKKKSERLYEVHGLYSRFITKTQIKGVRRLSDLIPNFPFSWISAYKQVEISGTCGGAFIIACSINDTLTQNQLKILNTVDMASDLVVNIRYDYKVPVTNIIEHNMMNVLMTVVPEKQAEFTGGYEKMMDYLKSNSITYFSEADAGKFYKTAIKFTVNETGEIVKAIISHPSGNKQTDRLLLELIQKMPTWKPAENAEGLKVKQDFEFTVGNNNGC